MTDPSTNYLKNSAPELKDQFIGILKKIFHFSELSESLLHQLFNYSKFVHLADAERPVHEGMFGQDIYILIHGRLEIFIKTESGEEEQIDVIYKPFSLFGEQCILGEQHNASVQARGEVLLIGIDISALPDVLDGYHDPEKRLEDEAYRQNVDMYTVFATVLVERLNRLITDQYKLMQKIIFLHYSLDYLSIWKQNVMSTTIFNEFCKNQLSPELDVDSVLKRVLGPYELKNENLETLISKSPVDTGQVYLELVRSHALGELKDLNGLLLDIMQQLALNANNLDEYSESMQFRPHDTFATIPLSEYLSETHQAIVEANIPGKPLSKEQFLVGILVDAHLNPSHLAEYLKEGEWVRDQFGAAYLMYLVCQNCIRKESEVNQIIAGCINYLTTLNTPRQNTQLSELKNQTQNQALVRELTKLHQAQTGEEGEQPEKHLSSDAPQDSVEDLLSEFGL
ncbi:MAG: cyclic nucleotide-binding domain-containing protein [Proteobacteria bacterium]|nr:cyclic nucleotide-binding domain-containing protein [Pseudomonadota bacterium]